MSGYDYWTPFSQSERREELKRDKDTFHSRAQSALDDESGGRFSKLNPSQVVGVAVPTYPQIPSGPWSGSNPVPPNPAMDELGYDINEVEPVLQTPTPIPSETILADGSDRVGAEAVASVLVHDTPAVASTHAPTSPVILRDGEVVAGVGALSPIAAHSHSPSPKPWRRF
jgi:hypothetical protein